MNVINDGLALQLLDGPVLKPGIVQALGGLMKNSNQFFYAGKLHIHLVGSPLQFENGRLLPLTAYSRPP